MDDVLVSDAIVAYTGWKVTPSPTRADGVSRVIEQFGPDAALDLVPRIRELLTDFYNTRAAYSAPTLVAMGEQASAEFRTRHPEITDAAVRAMAWCYMWDFK